MSADALGIVETKGLMGAIETADAVVRAANVSLVGCEKIGSGPVTVMIRGNVGAIKAAANAGTVSAAAAGEVISTRVILRLRTGVKKILPHLE